MISKSTLVELYQNKQHSMNDVAEKLNVSISTVDWWMRKHKIPRRNRSSANYRKYNPLGDPFRIIQINSMDHAVLYGLGVGIFWGEGNKVSRNSLRVGNTDVELIKIYLRFLREICQVEERKIRFGLQLFNDSDPTKSLAYWTKELNADRSQFMKTVSEVKLRGKGSYRRKNRYGVVTVYVNNIKLVDWMHKQMQNVSVSPGSSVVERIHGGSFKNPPATIEIQ